MEISFKATLAHKRPRSPDGLIRVHFKKKSYSFMARLSLFRPMRGWHSFEANHKSVLKRCESHWGLSARSAVLGPAALWRPHKVRGLPGFSGMSPVKIWWFLVSCLSRAGLGVFWPPTRSVTPPVYPTIRTPYPVGRLREKKCL